MRRESAVQNFASFLGSPALLLPRRRDEANDEARNRVIASESVVLVPATARRCRAVVGSARRLSAERRPGLSRHTVHETESHYTAKARTD